MLENLNKIDWEIQPWYPENCLYLLLNCVAPLD